MDRQHPRFVVLNRRSLTVSLVIIACLSLAVPALAEYLGPDRETTVFKEVHVPEKDVWTLTHVDPDDGYADVCLIIHTCEEHPSVERQQALCGWTADNSGCDEWWEEQEVTITLPEATIDSLLEDCHPVAGWCTNSPTVALSGTEPVDGEVITLIEGTRNGETFACPGDSCDVPGLEGENSFTFWAHSSWGDTSQMGTLSFKVDSEGPFIGIPDSWYIWEPLAIAVDDSHGVDKVSLTIHSGSYGNRHYSWNLPNLPNNWIWDRYFGDVVAPIGNYAVTIEAKDGLGNVSTEHATIIIPAPETDTEALAALIEGDDGTGGDAQAEASNAPESSGEDSAAASEPAAAAAESEASESRAESGDQVAASSTDNSTEPSASTVSEQPQAIVAPSSEGGGSGVLWGAAALAAIAGATAFGLNRKRQLEAEIEAKRKEIAERRSERSFADHLKSLRQAAEARIAPIRTALIVASAEAARELARQQKVQADLAWDQSTQDRNETATATGSTEVAWQAEDADLSATHQVARLYNPPPPTPQTPVVRMTGSPTADATPTPPSPQATPTGTPEPPGAHQETPAAEPVPTPPGQLPTEDVNGEWDRLADSVLRNLPTGVGLADTAAEVRSVVAAGQAIHVEQVGDSFRVYGTRAMRADLGYNPYVNTGSIGNMEAVAQSVGDRVSSSVISGWTVVGLTTNLVSDTYLYTSGEIDRHEYAASLTVDTGATIGTALLGGFVAGATTGAIVGGSTGLGVGAVPGAVIGGVFGALVAAGASLAFEQTGAHDYVVDRVADLYRRWTGP